ncbi:peptidyl-prolyl cis-trans isomerase FKBP4 isoform X1 [Patella vulgata]|uniref:peptidyl-prolyl cis-trans isomerase FKBP4 isoform X1 n=1 Tax=Patella vulgata TaxID=6465 RepID=UPI00217FA9BA|nr:peptidyl-prolyl cis-trans isomerase FKBP4 isoform X1 [Patella vulgata]
MTRSEVDITPSKDGGVLKEILNQGDENGGSPANGDTVYVHYVGTLENGDKFDSSRDRGEKFEFQLGMGSVIKAWDLGVATMKKGEIAKFTCKAEYAYGASGSPPKIPPNATLIFEVELFSWKGEDLTENKDGGIIRRILTKGEGYKQPKDGSSVNVHYVGKYDGIRFDERDVQFEVGEASEQNVIEAIEIAVTKMKRGEKCHLTVGPQYAYGSTGSEDFKIPPNATLEYDVYLSNFEKAKEPFEMDVPEKLDQSELVKSKGTNHVKAGEYQRAIKCYNKVISYLEHETSLEEDEQKKRDALMLAAHLNLALCHLKLEENNSAVEQCDKALEMDSNNTKAFFRRGQAQLNKNEYENAKKDFEKVIALEPENKAAKNQIVMCNHKLKQFIEKEKKTYAGMFSRFAEQDAKFPDKNTPVIIKTNSTGEVMDNIDNWSNEMAKDMMSIEQEMAAFGETMPLIPDKENINPRRK